MITPFMMFLYPVLLGWFIGFFAIGYYELIPNSRFLYGVGILYIIPVFILWLLILRKTHKKIKWVWNIFISVLIFILLTQPFYRGLFYNHATSEKQDICYSRSLDDNFKGHCFKMFEGWHIEEYLSKKERERNFRENGE
ncbi:MAG: hypothetical protein GY828_06200 [Candidatus Gracilibacteria bacterium]|nr:hypothetical protein [Candidatus Gracilibacteria bacterium]